MPESNVRPIGARRRKAPAALRSHEEIYDLVEKAVRLSTDAIGRADLSAVVVQRVEAKVDKVAKAVGEEHEDERGQRVGTGIIGKMMRLEVQVGTRFGVYDGWVKIVIGFSAAAAILLPAIWWLVSGHVEKVLK